MDLYIGGSGSSGNFYTLTSNSGQVLMIECGIQFKRIQEAIDFNYSSVIGCIQSHCHGDHGRSAKQCAQVGINIYSGKHTIDAMGFESHRLHVIESEKQFKLGEFKILPLLVAHDVPCLSFLIQHEEMGKLLFVTDTILFPYKIPGITNIMAEANFDEEILNKRDAAGLIHGRLRDRVIGSHMSISTMEDLLRAQDISKVNNIVLLHLSESNSNAEDFKKRIRLLSGKSVHVAEKNMKIQMNLRPW